MEGEGRHLLRQRNWTVLAFCFSAEEKSIFFLFPTLSTWINCTEPTFQPNLYPLSAAALSSSFSISPAPETLKCSSTVVYQLLLSELSGHDGKKKNKNVGIDSFFVSGSVAADSSIPPLLIRPDPHNIPCHVGSLRLSVDFVIRTVNGVLFSHNLIRPSEVQAPLTLKLRHLHSSRSGRNHPLAPRNGFCARKLSLGFCFQLAKNHFSGLNLI